MMESYYELVDSFKDLDVYDKKEEVINELLSLLKLISMVNKNKDIMNEILPVIQSYDDEEEYFDELFTIIISLKEECAKLIDRDYLD